MDEEVLMKKIEEEDPFEARLKAISQDQSKEGFPQAWKIEEKGDRTVYEHFQSKKKKHLGLIVLKSLIWKGFVHIYTESYPLDQFTPQAYHQRTQASLYYGYGFKSDLETYFPKCP